MDTKEQLLSINTDWFQIFVDGAEDYELEEVSRHLDKLRNIADEEMEERGL
jgi:predicted glycosyl hydrolase (DUF1957 family)